MSQVRRRQLLLTAGAILVEPVAVMGQQSQKLWRIGYLNPLSPGYSNAPRAFTQGMHDLGYVEGKNFVIEWRFADGKYELLSRLAEELVRLKVDVIVAWGSPSVRAAQRATTAVPIVMASSIDPIGSGFAKSLARPGGNITGVSRSTADVTPKFVQFLTTINPKLSHLAVLVNSGNPGHPTILKGVQFAARDIGIKVLPVEASTPADIGSGFAMIKREKAEALIVAVDGLFIQHRRQIIELAIANRVPAIFSDRDDAEAGGLMSYGQNPDEFNRLAATYVDKILTGAKPRDLPIEQPTRFHLVINLKTAKVLGLTIPQELLFRADEVIE